MTLSQPTQAVATSLEIWKEMVATDDMSRLGEITHSDVVFRSPVAHTEYHSLDALTLALTNVNKVFENFEYHRFFFTECGTGITMEFSASIGDKKLKGVDLVQFNQDGKITQFEVMVRPYSALQALAKEMGARVGESLPNFKKA